MRETISSGTQWEAEYGYSRLVKVGERIFVSGTTGTQDGKLVGVGDVRAQTRQTLENIKAALEKAGASLGDVVRTRMYVVGRENALPVAEVHGEYFGEVRPASALVLVAGLLEADMLVEIEADAIVNPA